MSVDSIEEPFEATVPPVQVNPFGNAQAQNHVVLRPLSHKQIVILQDVIGLKEKRRGEKNHDLNRTSVLKQFSAKKTIT